MNGFTLRKALIYKLYTPMYRMNPHLIHAEVSQDIIP